MRYYIIAGEASGDLHGSNLIKELQLLDSDANIRCWGGNKMQATGATLVKHYKDLAFMGFAEVIKNLRTILKNLEYCKRDILSHKPTAVVLIDYPGFNLRIAEWAHHQKIKVIFYISPQVWAWKESRVKLIKRCVDKMLVILPFEKDFYKKWQYDVEYVGHPLVQVIDEFKARQVKHNDPILQQLAGTKIIALLPGSRKQEILKKLPVMLQVAKHFEEYNFVVAKAPGVEDDFYEQLLSPYTNVFSVTDKTYELLSMSAAALVTSGTATLETALFNVPEVICYKGSAISYQVARRLIKIKYICLVNLIMDKEVVKELIQGNLTVPNIKRELEKILFDTASREQLQEDYAALKSLLSKGGNASANAAKSMYNYLLK